MTTIPSITPLPTDVPTTADPANFDDRADALLVAFPPLVTEQNLTIAAMNTVAGEVAAAAADAEVSRLGAAAQSTAAQTAANAAVSATGYAATSTTSLVVGTGTSKAFTTQAGKSFAASDDRVTAISRSNPSVRMRGPATYAGTTLTITPDEATGSGTFADWILVLSALETIAAVGKQAIWIPASAMLARGTSGAATGLIETTTNKINHRTLNFDASAIEYAQFAIRMPKSWDEGSVTFVPVWSHAATTTNFKVSWGLQAVALSSDDASDAAFGTAQYSNHTGGTTDDIYFGPESAAITVGGSPAAEDLVICQLLRKADDATNDTLAIDGRLHGLVLFINVNAGNDA